LGNEKLSRTEEEIEACKKQIQEHADNQNRHALFLEAMKDKSDKILNLELRVQELQARRESRDSSLRNLENQKRMCEELIEKIRGKENPHTPEIRSISKKIKDHLAQAVQLESEVQELLKLLDIYTFWEVAFSDRGTPSQSPIKSYLFDAIVPVLDELARTYSEVLTSGSMEVRFHTVSALKNGELRDKFSVEVTNAHGADEYLGDSGGERRKVDLVVMFALHSLARIRSGSQVDCLFLDEILDSLDAEGCERVVYLLGEMRKEIPKIFLITHNENLKNRFSSRILVRKELGVSKIVG
jgi:DNA repair exonuclease SbcCD ATPase subunit